MSGANPNWERVLFAAALVTAALVTSHGARAAERTELAGNPLTATPDFEFVRSFYEGQSIALTVDPSIYPQFSYQKCDVYVVENKSTAQWASDPSLSDVRGAAQVETFACSTVKNCARAITNAATLSSDANCLNPLDPDTCTGVGRGYDLVLDCDRNGSLTSADLIDGRGDEAGFYVVHDTTQSRLATSNFDVNVVDGTANPFSIPSCGLAPTCLPLDGCERQRIYYPDDIAQLGPRPLVVVSHGNGHCYENYNYLQQHLASYGYVVVSHQNDTQPGPGAAADTTLKHTDAAIEMINGSSCASRIGSGNAALCGNVDASRIVWIGHSRGGNGAVWGLNRLRAAPSDPIHYAATHFDVDDIQLVSSMAPIDFLIESQVAAAGTTPYHLIWGGGDIDVSGIPGTGGLAFRLLERADGPRQSIYVHGGAHGWFHEACTPGSQALDCQLLGPSEVNESQLHDIVLAYYVPLLSLYTESNEGAADLIHRDWSSFRPPGAAAGTVAIEFREGDDPDLFVIDDFETQPSLSTSSSGGAVSYSLGAVVPESPFEGVMEDTDCHFDWLRSLGTPDTFSTSCSPPEVCPPGTCPSGYGTPSATGGPCDLDCVLAEQQPMNGMTRSRPESEARALTIQWSDTLGSDFHYEFEIISAERDLTHREFLSFRAAQMPRHPLTESTLDALNFAVTLRDELGNVESLEISNLAADILNPYQRRGPFFERPTLDCTCCGDGTGLCCNPDNCNHTLSGNGWQAEFETVRIRLADFFNDGSPLDRSRIEAVQFDLGSNHGSANGRIALDDIELSGRPTCPAVTACNGLSCLKQAKAISAVDTGLAACVDTQGALLDCGSQSVHVATYSCKKAACCFENPGCFCQNDPCPSGTYLECR